MQIAWSAKRTGRLWRSASEYTATVGMPRSLQAQMMRRAISPRFAIRIFLNWPDAKEGFSVFHRLSVLHQLTLDNACHVGFDLVHQLHRFDDAQNFARRHMLPDTNERRCVRRCRFV